jgi:YesN/AraC family two-component response regulator
LLTTKLLILFNDNSTRDYLINSVPWNTLEFEIVGIESNGLLGLELFQYFEPDIVLLDSISRR